MENYFLVALTALFELDLAVLPYQTDDLAARQRLAAQAEEAWTRAGVFVDADPRAVSVIKENLRATGLAEQARVVQSDVLRFLADAEGTFYDVAFADPPYAFEDWPALLAVVPARLVAIEARTHVALGEGWGPLRSKRYGDTVVTLARRVEGE